MPISPNQGAVSGGTTVTITGVNLAGATAVHFNENSATITANTPTMVTVVNPPGNGVNEVTIVTAGGTSNPLAFYYILNPVITSISQLSGPTAGGNTIQINGQNLSTANSVDFGGNAATPTIISDSIITVVVPAGTAAISVLITVTTVGGSASGYNYLYVDAPTIASVSPTSGSTTGGTSVTVNGTNFPTTTSVTVGGTLTSFGVINSTTLAIITPVGTAGAADIVVTTTAGSATSVGAFTYVSNPGI
jgi:hypothetical protein